MSVVAERPADSDPGFTVALENFQGPFDVLLSLIAKHEMDITHVALSVVTDEFIRYVKALQEEGDRLPGGGGDPARPQGRAPVAARGGGG